jgi:hypothetical protein
MPRDDTSTCNSTAYPSSTTADVRSLSASAISAAAADASSGAAEYQQIKNLPSM